MHTPDLRRIRDSFAWFAPCGPALIAQAVRLAADRDEDIRAMLPDDQEHLNTLLFRTLAHVVKHADHFALLEAQLGTVAQRASQVGLRPSQYPLLRDCLLKALANLAGENWTRELAKDWFTLLEGIHGIMLVSAAPARRAA
ncbi:MAG TPA: globin domain-containing protein [Phycisphaerales bacterium]|nr:globin domain-containing protein [Phycisphaerales bacterium]